MSESIDMKNKKKLQRQFKILFEHTGLLDPNTKLTKEEDKATGAILKILIQMGHTNWYAKFDVLELYDTLVQFLKDIWTDKKIINKDGEEEDLLDKAILAFITIHFNGIKKQ